MMMQVLCMPMVKVQQKIKSLYAAMCPMWKVETVTKAYELLRTLDVSDSELPASVRCSNCGKNNHSADQCWNSAKNRLGTTTTHTQELLLQVSTQETHLLINCLQKDLLTTLHSPVFIAKLLVTLQEIVQNVQNHHTRSIKC